MRRVEANAMSKITIEYKKRTWHDSQIRKNNNDRGFVSVCMLRTRLQMNRMPSDVLAELRKMPGNDVECCSDLIRTLDLRWLWSCSATVGIGDLWDLYLFGVFWATSRFGSLCVVFLWFCRCIWVLYALFRWIPGRSGKSRRCKWEAINRWTISCPVMGSRSTVP